MARRSSVEAGAGINGAPLPDQQLLRVPALWAGAAGAGSRSGRPGDRDPEPSDGERRGSRRPGPGRQPVVMSSEVWHAYRVTRAPWCVVVEDGVVTRRRRSAPGTWAELNEAARRPDRRIRAPAR